MFEYPIKDPQPIEFAPQTLRQFKSKVTEDCKPELQLVLSKHETGWVLVVDHPSGQFALGQADGVYTRIFRTTKPLTDPLRDMGMDSIYVPITSERFELHTEFLETRRAWLQKQLSARKLTNQKLGDRLGVHNSYISMVLTGSMTSVPIENEICSELGMAREDLFPAIPDQVL